MNNNITQLKLALVFLFLSNGLHAADYKGDWEDNGTGVVRIGDLRVTDNAITIINVVSYSIALDRQEGDVNIYKVRSASINPDPLGCGPDSKVTYLIIQSLPDLPLITQKAIRVWFYGRSKQPDMKTIADEPGVCAIYIFGRSSTN
ncbi:MAG: hypothetical protein OEY07_20405 [Gammaproteobacteria bacterium]|nr:hypothetical protein [Gammaproteobacteria bacterium]